MNKREVQQNKVWEEDRKKYNLKYPSEDVVRFLKKNFETGIGKTILDYGCGSGRNTLVMADMGFTIYAMDKVRGCLELTREKADAISYKNIEYIQNEDEYIPLTNESVDCVVAWGLVMLLGAEKCESVFREIYRILKPNGCFLADYRTKDDSIYGCGTEIEKDMFCLDDRAGNLSGMEYWFPDKENLLDLYEKNGLCVYNIEKKEHSYNNLTVKNSYFHIWAKK